MNKTVSVPAQLLLASSSSYRRMLLERLGIPFETVSPDIDETPHDGESVEQSAIRLAYEKALAVQKLRPNTCILASDQLCSLNGNALGKPGTIPAAIAQLECLSGQTATFFTAICLRWGEKTWQATDETHVQFRKLSSLEINNYLEREPALDCAGSFMSERLGISLCDAIINTDPTALIGLPLIATARLLRQAGFTIP